MSRLAAVAATALAAACATPDIPGTYKAILPAASGGGERHVPFELAGPGVRTRVWRQ